MRPARIFTVLRSGGEYRVEHVAALAAQCARRAPGVEFACLGDDPAAPGHVPLLHDWPGWWAKIELFRFRGPLLFLDLDTVLRGSLTPLLAVARERPFAALADFDPRAGRPMASGVMAWSGRVRWVYEAFRRDPARHMADNMTREHWGDQGFIGRRVKRVEHFQALLPGAVASWKLSPRDEIEAARVVCFHGRPRPWEVDHGLL